MPEFAPSLNLSALNGATGFQLNGEAVYDHSGQSVSTAGDVNGDGFADLIIGAPLADPNGSGSGASYVVFGKASGFSATLNLSSLAGSNGFEISGEDDFQGSGVSVSSAGDLNRDGLADLLIGSGYAGLSHVVFGKSGGFPANIDVVGLNGADGFQITRRTPFDGAGTSVSNAGDVNGDGFADIIVGAPFSAGPGASYVLFGKASGFVSNLNLSTLNNAEGFRITGESIGGTGQLGFSVSDAGDVNNDGFDDLIVGTDASANGMLSGASYVIFGKSASFGANLDLSALDGSNGFQISGEAEYDYSGASVSSAGDVNSDGFADILIGAPYADPHGGASGASYVVFGRATGFAATLGLSTLNGSNGFQISGKVSADQSGHAVSGAGDVNGDGFDDLIIGAPRGESGGIGSSFVVFGKAVGFAATFELSSINGNNGFLLLGEADRDYTGAAVSGAGDLNGDGFDDLVIGAHGADPNGNASGASYVVFGHRAFAAVTRVGTGLAQTINGGIGGDRIDGRGGHDILIGWEGNDVYTLNDLTGPTSHRIFDRVVETAGAGVDSVNVASLDNVRRGADGYVLGDNIENGFITGTRSFFLQGNSLGNTLAGNVASNTLEGRAGNDFLIGGNGDDVLTGGLGRDGMSGESGRDRFDFNAIAETGVTITTRDRIDGFTHLSDRIDLSSIDTIQGGTDNAFVYRGMSVFTAAGQIRLQQAGADTLVAINTIGTSGAEATILLAGVTASTLSVADFFL